MKKALYSFLFLVVSGATPALAQSPLQPDAPTLASAEFFAAPELVLPRLYEAAISHSAEVAQLEASRQIASEDLTLTRKKPLNMLALSSSYNYGTLPYFAASDGTAQVYQFNPFSQGARAQYSAGVSVVAPLDVLFSRRSTVHRQELVLTRTQAEKQQKESEIRQLVIVRYQEVTMARTAVLHYQDALQSASVSRKIADRRFKEGEIQVDEQMVAMDYYGKALLAHEEAKSKYQTAQLLLEELIGMPITLLMIRK